MVIGRDAVRLRARIAHANSVVFYQCEPLPPRRNLMPHSFADLMSHHTSEDEPKLPVFPECRVLFVNQCDQDFFAQVVTAASFPKLTHVYANCGLGTGSPNVAFPDTVQWILTRGCPEFGGIHSRITYADYTNFLSMAASPPGRRSQTRSSSDSDVATTIKRWTSLTGPSHHAARGARRWSTKTKRQSKMSRSGSDWSLCPADFHAV